MHPYLEMWFWTNFINKIHRHQFERACQRMKNKFLVDIIDNIRCDYDEFSDEVQAISSHNNNSSLQLSHFKKG